MMRSPGRSSLSRQQTVALWISLLLLAAAALPASQAAAEKSWGYDLSHELMSPFCPGRTLATCPSPQAAELVQWIVTQEAAGVTREQVIEILIERHGEEILGAPPAEGITLWAYVFPVVGFLFGGVFAFVVLRRIVGRDRDKPTDPVVGSASIPTPSAPESRDDELARIVDAELAGRS